jgi:hypothetical protein
MFSIDIAVSDVLDLYGWQFKLGWNPYLCNVVSVVEGPFLQEGGRSTFFAYNISSADGLMIVYCTLLNWIPGVSGSGILSTVTFYTTNPGECPLDLHDVLLIDSFEQPISCQTFDGYLHVINLPYDVGIDSIVARKNIVGEGYLLTVNVTAANNGDFTETFTVILRYGSNTIGTCPVSSLAPAEHVLLVFSWNTTGVPKLVNYTLNAEAESVPNETYLENNMLSDGVVIISLVGDITALNGWPDGRVDMRDIGLLAKNFGIVEPDLRYNPNLDLDSDGKINMKDIAAACKNFGKTYP